ncbi:MAG: hypothetical protein NTX79_00715 [Candidatus Micrarchaeota archaeon]|nr:hypothetical protein [Candidatus Micrarchaeota archaeon]
MNSSDRNRIELGIAALSLLREVQPVNGEANQVARTANRVANALKAEYGNPETSMRAAELATDARSLGRGVLPLVDTLCLS